MLQERAFAAALLTAADLHGDGFRLGDERCVVPASPHPPGKGLYDAVLGDFHPAVCGVAFNRHGRRNDAGAERGRNFFLVADAPALCAVLRGETGRLKDSGMVAVILRHQRSGLLLGHGDAAAPLRVYTEDSTSIVSPPACRSSAFLSTSGSSFPRTEALRSIPRHAFGLK